MNQLDVFTILAAVAWADGQLRESEANLLVRVILTADLSPDEREAAGRLLDAPVALPDAVVTTLSPEARRDAYRAACRMAVVDKSVAEPERSLLAQLRGVLGIAHDIADEIEAEFPALRGGSP